VETPIVVAVISAVFAVASAVIAVFGQLRATKLQAQLDERAAEREAETEAEKALARYREPLASAAFDLQSRLYNILEQRFLSYLASDRKEAAIGSTVFRFAQYFGWTEILRRDIQFLNFGEVEETQAVARLQAEVTKTFASDKTIWGRPFMIWSDEQRAIGERMIVEEHGVVLCVGYARFIEKRDELSGRWLEPLERDIHVVAAKRSVRLAKVQNLLCDLLERLDSSGVRYDRPLKRVPIEE
jgi:hypothetical protein